MLISRVRTLTRTWGSRFTGVECTQHPLHTHTHTHTRARAHTHTHTPVTSSASVPASNSRRVCLRFARGRLIVEYACETEGCVVLAGGLMRLLEAKDVQGAACGSLRPSHAGLPPNVMISG